nr:phosphoribosylaminoimidazolesuccinocarboxamide synthase [Bacilli bacterium]
MERKQMLYEGKAKRLFAVDQEDVVLVEFKNDATAFNGAKKGQIEHKGALNNQISTLLFDVLHQKGIRTHFVEKLSDTEMLVKKVTIVPLEVVTRNIIAGSLSKRLGQAEGTVLKQPVVEFYYKDDALGDPLINRSHALALELATREEMDELESQALTINAILRDFLRDKGIDLIDFKLEFGRLPSGEIVLADEISPDTCRFWDLESREKLDKDRFRRDLGNVEEAYQEIYRRIKGETL